MEGNERESFKERHDATNELTQKKTDKEQYKVVFILIFVAFVEI